MNIHFLGAAGTVTGSKYLLEFPGKKILVDCGLFQGVKKLRELNWQQLPVEASDIDLVLLTHGHLDHTGFLPRLVKMGYNGHIWCTAPTLDITKIILEDSAEIQEEDAERAKKEGFSKHQPPKPLYTVADAEQAISRLKSQPEGEWIKIDDNIRIRFQYNGHILGAAFIEMEINGKRIVFSGDIGREADPLLREPKKPDITDVLLIESTYGDRLHSEEKIEDEFQRIIRETVEKGGTLIIPSFAVERAQLLMYLLWQMHKKNKIPRVPVILDSPMGANVLELFHHHLDWHKLSADECSAMCNHVRVVQSFKETWEIIDNRQPKIVIAGSGMVTGGRVLTYLQQYIESPETTVMLAGYQAEGTRGRQLLEGCSEIKFYGKYYPVKARIEYLRGLSGHADQRELLEWTKGIKQEPGSVFIVHGEPQAADMLRLKMKDELGWQVNIPDLYEIQEVEV